MNIIYVAVAALVVQTQAKTTLSSLSNIAKEAPAPAQTNVLNSDFLTGFESGIFLREKEEQIKEYGCPKAGVSMEEFRKVKEMMPAITTMIGVMRSEDKEMKNMMESLTLFVNHLDELIGVFDSSYNGGDFCAGLTFGQVGSKLLYNIASLIIEQNVKSLKTSKKQ